jgi:NAD(P)-dependent dehydrogenase (short-subunit alcohol dehydrogenase family)
MTRCILVTGAAGLLGVQHVKGLLADGHQVVASDINADALKDRFNQVMSEKLSLERLDVTNEDEIIKLSKKFAFNVLINNAAIDAKVTGAAMSGDGRLENFQVEDFNLEIGVGLTGAILCSKHIGSKMNSIAGGKIINIASDLSVISPDQRLYEIKGVKNESQPRKPVSYGVIKHGLIGLTKYLSTYWPGQVTCNALSPGGVYTNQSQEFLQNISARIPLNRMANLDEYQGVLRFLVSDASNYMNGQNIVMDGGRSVW